MPGLGLEDLDLEAAWQLFSDINILDQQALRTLRLVTQHQGQAVPIKGAVLLFGKNREVHFSDAWATATDPGSRTSNRPSNALDRSVENRPTGRA